MMKSFRKPVLPVTNKDASKAPPKERRLKRLSWMPNAVRNEVTAFLGEFVGTFMFLFVAFAATQVANAGAPATANNSLSQYPNSSNLMYISLAFGFSLAVNAWAFFRISGGLFNPAVTLALLIVGAIKPIRALVVFIAQFISGMCAAGIVAALFPGPLNVNTTLTGGTTIAQGLFIEMFLTAELVFVILMLAAEKHKATYLAPVGIGLALFVSELCGVYFTGGSLNPTRSFGPAVVTQFRGDHWIYWIGPCLGALLASGFYKLMKFMEYETVNPGQDFDDHEEQLFSPPTNAVTAEDVSRPNVTAATAEEALEAIARGETLSSSSSGIPLGMIGSRNSRSADQSHGSMTIGGNDEKSKEDIV